MLLDRIALDVSVNYREKELPRWLRREGCGSAVAGSDWRFLRDGRVLTVFRVPECIKSEAQFKK